MGAAVGAVLIRRERDVVDALRDAGVTAPERARGLDSLGVDDQRAVRRLVRHAVLREAAPGAYWLDEPSWAALRSMRRRVVAALLLVVALLALLGVFAARGAR